MDLNRFFAGLQAVTWTRVLVDVVIGVAAAVVVTAVISLVFRAIARRRHWPPKAVGALRRPFRVLLVVIGAWVGVRVALPASGSPATADPLGAVDHWFAIATILVAAWFLGAIVVLLVELVLGRYRTDVADNRVARRIRTQVLVIRRVAVALIVVLAIAAILLTFPAAQAAGASLLASAGVVSIIAGLAAQSTLGNVIAGVQLAFSGAIRIEDVVVANGEWGRIEEITLTYVVVHVWDDRRLVLPSTYFTTTPFENWTRTSSELMQAVEFDLDWQVDTQAMRDEMHDVLARTELWDGRVAVLQVTDAIGGVVHVRILVTAADAPTLFDLRCFVREELVRWLRYTTPQALPRTRYMAVQPPQDEYEQRGVQPPASRDEAPDRSLFSGDAASARRATSFTGPVEVPKE